MGRIRDFFNRIIRRREKKLLETTTQAEIKKFIDDMHLSNDEKNKKTYETFDSKKPTREHYERTAVLIDNFISLINDGTVDIGGDASESAYKRLLQYFKTDSIIYDATMDAINKKFYEKIDKASNGETYEQVHGALDATLEEYFKTIGSSKSIKGLVEIGKVKEIRNILTKNMVLVDDSMEVRELEKKISDIYEGTLLYRIRKEKDINKQIDLYEEYIRDFRNGKEIDLEAEKEYLRINVEDICQMEFMKVRELRKACEQHGIPPVAKVSKIYKTETFKTTRDRNDLLCEQHVREGKVETKTLDEIGTFTRGRRFVRTDIVPKGVPCIHYGDMYTYYGISADTTPTHLTQETAAKLRFAKKGDVVIVAAGENDLDIGVGVAWLGEKDVVVHDACFIFKHKMESKYISHYLRSRNYHQQIRMGVVDGKICSISAKELGRTIIPIPSLSEQQRIVSILDTFEASITNLELQLALREKQYEYYRNKLLTFE